MAGKGLYEEVFQESAGRQGNEKCRFILRKAIASVFWYKEAD